MDIDIKKHIIENFKNSNIEEIRDSIEDALSKDDEITLPGLGVFFQILWEKSDPQEKTNILTALKNGL